MLTSIASRSRHLLDRRFAGTGPWGLPTPAEVRSAVADLQRAAAPLMPRLRSLMALPGAQQARSDLLRGLQASSSMCHLHPASAFRMCVDSNSCAASQRSSGRRKCSLTH